jgi:uncharacterized protein (UPF0332 family)
MSSKDIPRALLRKASHHIKDAHTLRSSGDLQGSAGSYYQSMLVASEALLYFHGETVQQPGMILEEMQSQLVDSGLFPEEAYSWLRDTHDLLNGGNAADRLQGSDLEDLEDQAEKFLITAENILL